ncbi:MAG TPA: polysaccharide biosynthesis/export family protein [Nitrospinota bacterium]|nr:polysaccharide biosynthesis/export family protein [Nitrospinota bacterium]
MINITKTSHFLKPIFINILVLLIFLLFNSSSAYPQEEEYTVGGKDLLDIMVFEESDLSKRVRISEDGYITFPLLGQVKVGGLTASQIEKKLAKLLEDGYLVNPQVSVMVKYFESRKVSVLGCVEKPGTYSLIAKTTILEAISKAGGLDMEEKFTNVVLIRPNPKGANSEMTTITINLNKLLKGKNTSLNIEVKNKDTIIIPRFDTVFVFGQVRNPGAVVMEKDITIVEAIALAGGFTRLASENRTRVIRVVDGKLTKITVKMADVKKGDSSKNIILKPEDIVVVPERFF